MFPVTPAAEAALSVATRFCSPALLNHCVRSYLWGAMYGTAHGIAFDDELYYVAALLHDIGLTEAFDSHRLFTFCWLIAGDLEGLLTQARATRHGLRSSPRRLISSSWVMSNRARKRFYSTGRAAPGAPPRPVPAAPLSAESQPRI